MELPELERSLPFYIITIYYCTEFRTVINSLFDNSNSIIMKFECLLADTRTHQTLEFEKLNISWKFCWMAIYGSSKANSLTVLDNEICLCRIMRNNSLHVWQLHQCDIWIFDILFERMSYGDINFCFVSY